MPAHSAQPANHVRQMAAEDAAIRVQLVDDDDLQVLEELRPPRVMRQDPRVEHVGIAQHHVRARPDRTARVLRSVAVVGEDANLAAALTGDELRQVVEIGQLVQPGQPLLSVVADTGIYVTANLKETQLDEVRVGEPVELEVDAYGGCRALGTVESISGATGAKFSLIPPENATGNFTKVVQRVPVRIALERAELQAHPLQIGLSMKVDVDTHDRSAGRVPRAGRGAPAYETRAFVSNDRRADERIEQIIVANTGIASANGASARR